MTGMVTHRDIDWSVFPDNMNRAERRKLAAETRLSLRRKRVTAGDG